MTQQDQLNPNMNPYVHGHKYELSYSGSAYDKIRGAELDEATRDLVVSYPMLIAKLLSLAGIKDLGKEEITVVYGTSRELFVNLRDDNPGN